MASLSEKILVTAGISASIENIEMVVKFASIRAIKSTKSTINTEETRAGPRMVVILTARMILSVAVGISIKRSTRSITRVGIEEIHARLSHVLDHAPDHQHKWKGNRFCSVSR